MNRHVAVAILGLIWVGYGVVFALVDEPRFVLGQHWEDIRGWVWVVVGLLAVGAAVARQTRYVTYLLGGLAGERLVVWALLAEANQWHLPAARWGILLGWVSVQFSVWAVASIPSPSLVKPKNPSRKPPRWIWKQ